jgi:hypothetical protein
MPAILNILPHWSAPVMIKECLPCAATSAAKDGEAPESSPDGSLRDKPRTGGAVCAVLTSTTSRVLKITILAPSMSHCAATVLPSTNPSRVQRRRYVISDSACHSCSAVLIDQWCCLLGSRCSYESIKVSGCFAGL